MNVYFDITKVFRKFTLDGGPGSGNFSHAGRPGKKGGSQTNPSTNNPPGERVYGVDRISSEKEKSALKSMSALSKAYYNSYVKHEQKVTTDIERVLKINGLKMVGEAFALKMPGSFNRKVATKMKDDGLTEEMALASLHDVVRYTGLSSAKTLVEDAKKTLDEMKSKGYKIAKVKNSWQDKKNPYHGINCQLVSPDGIKMELQFHTPQSFDMKEHKQHKLYEIFRSDKASEEEKTLANAQMWALINNNIKWTVPKNIELI